MTTPAPDPCVPCGPGGGGTTTVIAGPGVDVTGDPTAGYTVSVTPSPAPGNIISTDADGNMFLDCADVALCVPGGGTPTTVTAGVGVDITGDPTAGYTVSAPPSTDVGNLIETGTDGNAFLDCAGITAACGSAGGSTTVTAGPGVDVTGDPTAGYTVSAAPSTEVGNLLTLGPDGNLLVSCASVAACPDLAPVIVRGDPLTPEIAVTQAGNVYTVTVPPLITPRARVRTAAVFNEPPRILGGDVIEMGTVVYDRGGMFVGGPGSTALVVPPGWDGIYSMGANVQYRPELTDSDGFRSMFIRINGATLPAYEQVPGVVYLQDSTILNIHTDYELVGGDVIEMFLQQDNGSAAPVPIFANDFSAVMWATFLNR